MGEELRQCYICLEQANIGDIVEEDWVSPCKCTGSIAWVHKECLLHWVREMQRTNLSLAYTCTMCNTRFQTQPEVTKLDKVMWFFYENIVPGYRIGIAFVLIGIKVDATLTFIGASAFLQVYGLETVKRLVSADPGVVTVVFFLTSLPLVLISWWPWEQHLLQLLRKGSSLPIVCKILPQQVPARYQSQQRKPLKHSLTEAILLPTIGKVVGALVFPSVTSLTKRALLGGAFFVVVKGVIWMWSEQSWASWRSRVRFLPYQPPPVLHV